LNTLKAIYSRYSNAIFHALQPLGMFGVFALAFIDSAAFGMPLDPVVAWYVYNHKVEFWAYVLLAAARSAAGSLVIYFIGKKGGEALLHSRMSHDRVERMRIRFEDREFVTLMVASVLPPPTPFKLFVISAAVFQMRIDQFLLSIFVGRAIRFTILALLTIRFGPQVVTVVNGLIRDHLLVTLIVLGAGVAAILIYIYARKRRRTPATARISAETKRPA
jgi:membrane protein YqaA with SNARE-associated domain